MPLVSCICATYNRPPDFQYLLEEAIESFLRQTYPNKELIVLNDCPGQELACHAPNVRVVNVPERFATLGEKHNAAIALSNGDFLAVWDDDDISLPWRLSLSIDCIGDADYYNPNRHWYMVGDKLNPEAKTNIGHNLSLFRRSAFELVGGYQLISVGYDLEIDRAFRRKARCVGSERGETEIADSDLYYIYRWGVSPIHVSAGRDMTSEEKYARVGQRQIQPGYFQLRPRWRRNYVSKTRKLLQAEAVISDR